MQLTLGAAILSALVHGPWAVWLALGFAVPDLRVAPVFLMLAAVSYAAGMLMALAAPGKRDWRRVGLAATLPLY